MGIITLSKSEKRRLTLFLTCLFIAIFSWLFFALSNHYVYKVKTQVHYINFPENKAFHPLQGDTVNLQIQGTGWQLLFSRLRIKPQSVDVSLKNLNRRSFVTFTDQLGAINNQFESNQKVVSVYPDTLYFDFSARSVKKVPIRLSYDIQFKNEYYLSDKPKITPSYVIVTGPLDVIKNIDFWPSDSVKLKDISTDTFVEVALKASEEANIDIYPNRVNVKFAAEQFTEKTVEVPLKIKNNRYFDVRLLPEKVFVKVLTSLSSYTKIDRDAFEITVDLDNWALKNYPALPVHLEKMPAYVKLVSIEPQTINFLVKR